MHRISLSRAWQVQPIENNQCVLIRKFNRPTGLLPQQRVWLNCEVSSSLNLLHAELNHRSLPLSPATAEMAVSLLNQPHCWSIELLLSDHNQLSLTVTAVDPSIDQQWQVNRLSDLSAWLQCSLQLDAT